MTHQGNDPPPGGQEPGPSLEDLLGKPARPAAGSGEPELRRLNVGSKGSARGRKATPLFAEVARELEACDLAQLETKLGVNPQPLARVRDTHHKLARTLAEGYSQVEASALTGFSPSRISILTQDPSFKELVAFYRQRVDATHADVIERMKGVSLDALTEIQDRLHDSPESFKVNELLEIMSRGFDRSGYGPSSTVQHQGEVLHSHEIRAIMQEAEELQNVRSRHESGGGGGQVLEGKAEETSAQSGQGSSQSLSQGSSSSAGRASRDRAGAGQRAESPAGGGGGADPANADDPAAAGVGDDERGASGDK